MHYQSSWRWLSESPLARALCCFCACVLLSTCWPHPLPAATLSENERSALLESLTTADRLLTALEQSLQEQSQHAIGLSLMLRQAELQLSRLGAALTLWREHSEELGKSLAELSSALARLRTSHAELTRRYARLSSSWQDYREQARLELVRTRRRTALVAGGLGLLLGGLLGAILAR